MPEVGSYDAKTHLPKLLDRVEKGERFVITKHGRPVAELVPLARPNPEAVRRTIADIRAFRKKLSERGVQLHALLEQGQTLRELAHQGHRF